MKLSSHILLTMVLVSCGCEKKSFNGPTVSAFIGKVTHEGQPVSFSVDEKPVVQLFHEKGQSFGIPIQPDGTFKIGWMPIGKYSALLMLESKPAESGGQNFRGGNRYTIPDGLTIEAGKTEYGIELGKDWKR